MNRALTLCLFAMLSVGCGDDDGDAPADRTEDAATTSPADASKPGAADAGGTDAGGTDAGGGSAIPTLNGCSAADYLDRRGESDPRTIAVGSDGLVYTPKCMTIARGQKVKWEGSLAAHPLKAGNPDQADAGTAGSPILLTSEGSSVEFTFPAAGTYPYYCTLHAFGAGQGMAGSVHVE